MYFLGRLADADAERAVGLAHARPVRWIDRPFAEDDVPPAVAATFARGGRNLQRTRDAAGERRTAQLWRARAKA